MHRRPLVKVCGITRPQDAKLVEKLGGDLIGLIRHRPSPRFVSLADARTIVSGVSPALRRVGVFVDEKLERVLDVARKLRLDFVQLHGNETTAYVRSLQQAGFKVIKAFAVRQARDYERVLRSRADLVLLDHKTEKLAGGTGEAFDWRLKPNRKIPNLALAGGISTTNLAEGMATFDPMVVDVNSQVESKPGAKSPAKLRAFFNEYRRIVHGR